MSCVLQPNKRQPVAHIPRGGHVKPVYAACHCDRSKKQTVPVTPRDGSQSPSVGAV